MNNTTKWTPQAAEIIDLIHEYLKQARQHRDADNINAALSRERVNDIEAILENIEEMEERFKKEKISGGPDNA